MKRGLATALLLTLAACSGDIGTPSEPLRILAPRLPEAVLGEPYSEAVLATGGLRPYTFSLDAGALPPGMTLAGGNLVGTPTELGTFEFTVSVSDANLASTFANLVLRVVEVPPPSLTLTPPSTDVQSPVTIRGRVSGARGLDALRTVVRYDPERFDLVGGTVVASRADVALFSEAVPGSIQIDLALLGQPLTGDAELFRFELVPLEPTTLALDSETEYLFGGRHHFAVLSEGTAAPEPSDGSEGPAPDLPQPEPDPEPLPEPEEEGA